MINFINKILPLLMLTGLILAPSTSLQADQSSKNNSSIYVKIIKADFGKTYKKVYKALEDSNFYVVFEPNIGKSISGFAKRWGKDYNQNKLEEIQSMVFCNGWYANKVSNADPEMLALCPLHLTMTHKKGITSILFVRPGKIAASSKAAGIAPRSRETACPRPSRGPGPRFRAGL